MGDCNHNCDQGRHCTCKGKPPEAPQSIELSKFLVEFPKKTIMLGFGATILVLTVIFTAVAIAIWLGCDPCVMQL